MTAPQLPELSPMPASYEAALAELDDLLRQLESGNTPLEALLAHYQRGNALLEFCRAKLAAVENQVRVLEQATQAKSARNTEKGDN